LLKFLGLSQQQKEFCRRRICQTPLGQFLSNARRPFTLFTGGLIKPFCPDEPTKDELEDKGPVGAAAKIKAQEAKAKARRAAIRYLGTVDCQRFPDAGGQLAKSLRGDTNECVRYEAALALATGCCCTKETMDALRISASCSDEDGQPKEQSDRVRAMALRALEHCLGCFTEKKEEEEKEPEKTPTPESSGGKKDKVTLGQPLDDEGVQQAAVILPGMSRVATYEARLAVRSQYAVAAQAKKTLDEMTKNYDPKVMPTGQRSLAHVLAHANNPHGGMMPAHLDEIHHEHPATDKDDPSRDPVTLWHALSRANAQAAGPRVSADPRTGADPRPDNLLDFLFTTSKAAAHNTVSAPTMTAPPIAEPIVSVPAPAPTTTVLQPAPVRVNEPAKFAPPAQPLPQSAPTLSATPLKPSSLSQAPLPPATMTGPNGVTPSPFNANRPAPLPGKPPATNDVRPAQAPGNSSTLVVPAAPTKSMSVPTNNGVLVSVPKNTGTGAPLQISSSPSAYGVAARPQPTLAPAPAAVPPTPAPAPVTLAKPTAPVLTSGPAPKPTPTPAPVTMAKPTPAPAPAALPKLDAPKPVAVAKPIEAPKPTPTMVAKPVEAPKPAPIVVPPPAMPPVPPPPIVLPKIEPPVPPAPKVEPAKVELPKIEPAPIVVPKIEAPKVEAPKIEAPKIEAPKVEPAPVTPPKIEAPKIEAPKIEAPKIEAPKIEAPKIEPAPVVIPNIEAPKIEAPKVEPAPVVVPPSVPVAPKVEVPTPVAPPKVEVPVAVAPIPVEPPLLVVKAAKVVPTEPAPLVVKAAKVVPTLAPPTNTSVSNSSVHAQVVTMLTQSPDPAARAAAVQRVMASDLQQHPELAFKLLAAARDDNAVSVRVACIQALQRGGVRTPVTLATLQNLANDPQPAVRSEAVQALSALNMGR
jgi:hypothetical protein